MQPFVFLHTQSDRAYQGIRKKFLSLTRSLDAVRLFFLITRFCINMFVYLYFVNRASTAGYFYGQAQDLKEQTEFAYNITKLRIVKASSTLRDTLQDTKKTKTVKRERDLWIVPLP